MKQALRAVVDSRRARLATIGLLLLQLGGCALDLTTGQRILYSGFCLVTADESLQTVVNVLWLTLSLSWIVGLVSLQFAWMRLLYWLLIVLAPVGYIAQFALLDQGFFKCDGP